MGSLLGGKVFVFIVRGACVLFGGVGRGSEKVSLYFMNFLVFTLFIY